MSEENPSPDPSSLSLPGEPSADEIRVRAQAVMRRAAQLGGLLTAIKVTPDDVTACALIAIGTSLLCSPSSVIDPHHRLTVTMEMFALGEATAKMALAKAAQQAREARRN